MLLSLGIDPDLRDHPSVVDWRKAAVLGKLGKQNRIDLTRNCELHELAKWHHLRVARSSAILLAHFLHVPYKDNLRRQNDNPNFLGISGIKQAGFMESEHFFVFHLRDF